MDSSAHAKYQSGSGLIEVMVALLILSVGLLGFAALQGNAIKVTREARQYSEASMLAYDFFDRIRTNRQYATTKPTSYQTSFDQELDQDFDCMANICSTKEFAAWDLADWKQEVARLIPDGDAEVKLSTSKISGYTLISVSITLRYAIDEDEFETWDFEAVI